MQRHQGAAIQIALAARHVHQPAEDGGPQRDGHGVHEKSRRRRSSPSGAAPPRAARRAPRSARGARRPRRPAAAAGRPRCARPPPTRCRTPRGRWPAPDLLGEPPREGGAVALHDEIHVERAGVAQQVAHEAARRPYRHPHGLPELAGEPEQPDERLAAGIGRLLESMRHRQRRTRPRRRAPVDEPDDTAAVPHQDQARPREHEPPHRDLGRGRRHLGQLVPGHLEGAQTGQPPPDGAHQLRVAHRHARAPSASACAPARAAAAGPRPRAGPARPRTIAGPSGPPRPGSTWG